MEAAEFIETFNLMLDDAAAIVHYQQVLAGIHHELDRNLLHPHEQDYILSDHYGNVPSEPRRHVIDGVAVSSRILHQAGIGLRDVAGADLLYEIERHKFGLIQYKRAGSTGRIKGDRQQLEKLLDNCPDVCRHKQKRPIPKEWLPLRINSYCGCWYCVIKDGERRYLHACEAEASFENRTEISFDIFRTGIDEVAFLSMFAHCRLGAFIRQVPREGEISSADYVQPLIEQRHVILEVRQSGRWTGGE